MTLSRPLRPAALVVALVFATLSTACGATQSKCVSAEGARATEAAAKARRAQQQRAVAKAPQASTTPKLPPIAGFDATTNAQLAAFFVRTANHQGRKVAVFDGDGTVLGQTPHYLADECLFAYAKAHPTWKPKIIATMKGQSNVSLPYVQNRIRFLSGLSLEAVREMGLQCFKSDYHDKIFAPMKALIDRLKRADFEVWIVTASPEFLYQRFLSQQLGLPETRIIGVKSVVSAGITTDRMVTPVPQDKGKLEAIETFVQVQPLLVGGNSRGDKEMIEHSADLKLIVNPDEHIAPGQKLSVADYAKKHHWLRVRIRDVPRKGFPAVSSKDFGMRLNKTRDVKATAPAHK